MLELNPHDDGIEPGNSGIEPRNAGIEPRDLGIEPSAGIEPRSWDRTQYLKYRNNQQNLRSALGQAEPVSQYFFKNSTTSKRLPPYGRERVSKTKASRQYMALRVCQLVEAGEGRGVRVGCISADQRAKDQRNRIILKVAMIYKKSKKLGNFGFELPFLNKVIVYAFKKCQVDV
jgi:hypothetical protein